MTRTIDVEMYNPGWPEKYDQEAQQITSICANQLISIHNIGSTAIPGIKAKPVIDIMVVVHDLEKVDDYNPEMIQLGYIPRGEAGIPGRRFFKKESEGLRSHHVHFYAVGHTDIQTQLDFRDYMRAHPKDALAYSQLKEKLAQEFHEDPPGYTESKTEFVLKINHLAAQWREEERSTSQ